jgi:hypothetical protein
VPHGFSRANITSRSNDRRRQFVLDAGHIYAPIAPRLRKALSDTKTKMVVDLCCGAGGPWASLNNSLKAEGTPPLKILLTDKYPHATEVERRYPLRAWDSSLSGAD